MTRQLGLRTTFYRTAIFASVWMLLLSACGRSASVAPDPINTSNPLSGSQTPITGTTGTVTTATIPTTGTGTTTTTTTTTTPASFTCTLTMVGGSAVATQSPTTPSMVNYLLAISPTTSSVPQPVITSSPANAFTVSSLVPNGSNVNVTGNFNTAGTITLLSSVNISGQIVSCQTSTVVTVAATPRAVVYRSDRNSPPDLFYAVSQTAPSGYTLAGAMFRVYTQVPSTASCPSAVPLMQCILPISPSAVTFLTQVADCGGNPPVGQLGYTCRTSVSGTTPLYRVHNNIDHRYFTTASSSDVTTLVNQGWIYDGVIGYAPLQ